MNDKNKNQDLFLITFSDLLAICRKNRGKIWVSTLFFAMIAALFALTRAPEYKAEATFREKVKSQGDTSRSLSLALLVGISDGNENAAVSLMKSRKLIENVIQKRGLQAEIEKDSFRFKRLANIGDNLKTEYALFRSSLIPALNRKYTYLKASSVNYEGEIPIELKLKFTSEDTFIVLNKGAKTNGALGTLFKGPNYSFILESTNDVPLAGYTFNLTLYPISVIAEKVLAKLKVESDVRDKGLIKLAYKHFDRKEASEFLNALMKIYQDHLKSEHQRLCSEQIAYLHQRQEEASQTLKEMMEAHAQSLSNNMATIDFLFQNQQNFTQKMLLIDLELSRLQKADEEGFAFYDKYGWDGGDPGVINQILSEIRSHRQQADSIDIALRNAPGGNASLLKQSFETQHRELQDVKSYSEEAKAIHKALQGNKSFPQTEKLASNPKYMIRDWYEKLRNSPETLYECCKSNFNSYLLNLIHLLDVEEKILQERLTHQQNTPQEHKGIDLATANELYLNYSKNLNELESDILHHQFLLNQMEDPKFEVSALSTILSDPVSKEIIAKTSALSLLLQDQDNRSLKEQERIKGELVQQKGFLSLHIQQTAQLLNLRKKLFQDKIVSLQNAMLELIQQNISVLEQQMSDYIKSRMANLKQERLAIEQQQQILQKEMAKMPSKWASEKIIDQHLEMSKKMIEKITEAVETKNISSNLDLSQSAPLDIAKTPIHPDSSRVFLLSILGSLMGFLLSCSFIICRKIAHGVEASSHNLPLLGHNVVGSLEKNYAIDESLRDQDLETLRRLVSYVTTQKNKTILLLQGKGFNYAQNLADLLGKSRFRVLILPLTFNCATQPGLLQYLEGKLDDVPIHNKGNYDEIEAGGINRFANEWIGSKRFYSLLLTLQAQYDFVLAVSQASIASGEGVNLIHIFQSAIITLTDERLSDIPPPSENVIFITQ